MKKVLVISCYFPPSGGGGVQRTSKFVKYLPQFGWEPIVVTTKKKITEYQDFTLVDDIPEHIKVLRTFSLQPLFPQKKNWIQTIFYALSIPDLSVWWLPFALYEGLKQKNKEKFDTIYVTGDPFSSYLIGSILKFITKKPLVIDFRDAWILDSRRTVRTIMQWRNFIEKCMFKFNVKHANKIILATPSMKKDFQSYFKSTKSSDNFISITNGYDYEDLMKIKHVTKNNNIFKLVYTGSLQTASRDPSYLIKALNLLKRDHPDVYKDINLYLVGSVASKYKTLVKEYGLCDCIHLMGYLPHNESLGYLEMADFLVFIMETQNNVRQITSGKIFEYIAFEKPILALASLDSDAADIIEETGLGIFVNPLDEVAIMDELLKLHETWKNRIEFVSPSKKNINKYTRRNLTEKLAAVLNEI